MNSLWPRLGNYHHFHWPSVLYFHLFRYSICLVQALFICGREQTKASDKTRERHARWQQAAQPKDPACFPLQTETKATAGSLAPGTVGIFLWKSAAAWLKQCISVRSENTHTQTDIKIKAAAESCEAAMISMPATPVMSYTALRPSSWWMSVGSTQDTRIKKKKTYWDKRAHHYISPCCKIAALLWRTKSIA